MKQLRWSTIIAFTLLPLVPASNASAQALAELMQRDSSSHLTLTDRSVIFEFTRDGIDKIRQQVDTTTRNVDGYLARTITRSVVSSLRNIRIPYSLSDIDTSEVRGATVIITFRNKRADDHTFDFDATDERSAQTFSKRLNDLLAERRR